MQEIRIRLKTPGYSFKVNGNEEMESRNILLPVINVISKLLKCG